MSCTDTFTQQPRERRCLALVTDCWCYRVETLQKPLDMDPAKRKNPSLAFSCDAAWCSSVPPAWSRACRSSSMAPDAKTENRRAGLLNSACKCNQSAARLAKSSRRTPV